jgi:hypothetical protein
MREMKRIRESTIRKKAFRKTEFVRVACSHKEPWRSVLVVGIMIFVWVRCRAPSDSHSCDYDRSAGAIHARHEKKTVPQRAQLRRPLATFRIMLPFCTDGITKQSLFQHSPLTPFSAAPLAAPESRTTAWS